MLCLRMREWLCGNKTNRMAGCKASTFKRVSRQNPQYLSTLKSALKMCIGDKIGVIQSKPICDLGCMGGSLV